MILNRIERVVLENKDKRLEILAKIDTGADRTSIDKELVKELNFKILDKKKKIRAAGKKEIRNLVKVKYKLKKRWINSIANVADRSNMSYKMIIGWKDIKGCVIKL